ncbi:DCN1-like protein 4/5 [Entomortierella parvispora]|uniref:Defective in cullin neddylation protein n=1 Tax=Entomortierella parvispora TaxID=205924 RepID=A0A9P3H6R6_9FUNG|nr:DCN1-like protein 4/5 [Entomortierella parvispora]
MGNKSSTSRGDINIKSRGAKVDTTPVSSFRTSPKSRDYDSNRLAAKSAYISTAPIPTTPTSIPVPIKDQFDVGRCTRWFESFTGLEEDDLGNEQIGPAGISKLCEDIGVSLEAVDMLVLAFHLNADTMPFFSKEEWIKGMKKLEVDSTIKLKAAMPGLVAKLKNPVDFKEFYRYIFMFVKNSEQKCMDVETACRMLETVMAGRPHTKSFVAFLEEKKPVKVINKDQWYNFLDFSDSVSEDLTNYDGISSAWPVLLDEYVEWRNDSS